MGPIWVFPLSFILCIGLSLRASYDDQVRGKHFEEKLYHGSVSTHLSMPAPDQNTVDLALALFSVRIPPWITGITFDPQLEERGLTAGSAWTQEKEVFIGPSALESWGILGSTLAHEVEVHGHQSFLLVILRNLLFSKISLGTAMAERQAYSHELRNAKRFGLSVEEIHAIGKVRDHHFPFSHAPYAFFFNFLTHDPIKKE